jgi:DNA invertase Pin-like site-specific DNA recombinase
MDIYCRISQDYDGSLRSVESQEEDCRDAIEDNDGWTLGKVFRDHALSAWDPKVERPEFDLLMTRLESGESDGVMVYDLTRFTRKPMEGERLLALASRGGGGLDHGHLQPLDR